PHRTARQRPRRRHQVLPGRPRTIRLRAVLARRDQRRPRPPERARALALRLEHGQHRPRRVPRRRSRHRRSLPPARRRGRRPRQRQARPARRLRPALLRRVPRRPRRQQRRGRLHGAAMTLALPTALVSADRSPNISEASDLYGFLVGSWHLEVRSYAGVDVTGRNLRGEVHAARVLEGRGIQDTWIMPPRGSRTGLDPTQNMYGTTLRLWDSSIQAWRIAWSNPASNHYEQQIGRAHGKDIVQLGVRPNGT